MASTPGVTFQAAAEPAGLVDRVLSMIENRRAIPVAGFSAFFLLVCALVSATKLMWYDELNTYLPAKLPFHDLLAFFGQALDVHTPTASIVLYASMKLLGDNPVADRLPFALGFLVMSLAIYRFVARRLPVEYAVAAMIFPAASGVFYYATEIRCYGLELGCAGLALVCWQEASDGRRRAVAIPALFLSLAAALCCHYFAAFLWIPLGLAELARSVERKRVDVPVWGALILSPSVLLLFLPAIRAARGVYSPDSFALPGLGHISNAYLTMLAPTVAPILAGAVLYFLLAPKFSRPAPELSPPPLAERVLAATLALTPVFGALASYILGTYVYRYTLYAIAGISIFLAFGLCRALKGDRVAGIALSIALVGWFGLKGATTVHNAMAVNGGLRTPLAAPYQNSEWMRALEGSSLPVAATPAVFFLQLAHYAPEPVRGRVVYAGDHALALKFDHADTGETNLFRYARLLPIDVVEFNDFVAGHRHFLLAAETTYSNGWQIPALIERGARLRLLNRTGTYWVFDVTMQVGRE